MKFNVTPDRDEDGAWVAECTSIPGCGHCLALTFPRRSCKEKTLSMRAFFHLGWVCLLVSAAVAQIPIIPEIAAVRDPYVRNLTLIRAARDQRATPITTAYLAALGRLEKQLPSDPAITAERERIAAKREPLDHERKAMPPALAELRARYDNDLVRSNTPFQQQEHQQTRQYISMIETVQRRLTAQNQVAKAAAARAEGLAAAATLPQGAIAAPDGNSKPIAESTIRGSTVKAVGTLDPALADKLAAAGTAKAYTRTESSSQNPAMPGWADVPETGGLLVGFEFFEVGKEKRIRSLRPYYMTRTGIVAGKDRGKMEKVTDKIIARPGYAVAGFLGVAGKNGMQILFMKIDPASGRFATDSASTYKSQWFGEKSRDKPLQIGGDGRLVIGVYGKTGADCDDLGLVLMN